MMNSYEIRSAIRALDEEFSSPVNGESGKLKLGEYTRRHIALRESLADAERVERAEAQAPRPVRRKRFVMQQEKAARLARIDAALDYARDHGDAKAFRAALSDDDYAHLHAERALVAFDGVESNLDEITKLKLYGAKLEALLVRTLRLVELNALEANGGAFEASLDGRTLTLALGGTRQSLLLPIPIFKGVFRSGESYAQSDVVVFGGSQWICLRDTNTRPPGDDWQLSTRGARSSREGRGETR